MKTIFSMVVVGLSLALVGCKKTPPETTDLSVLADAVPNVGAREGNNYKVFAKMLRESSGPAQGFKVEASVKDKGGPKILVTDKNGIVIFKDLPFPDATHPLSIRFHYYKGTRDQSRSIRYPYLESDAYRLKDTQYIPDTVTPDPNFSEGQRL